MKTKEKLKEFFTCTDEQAARLLDVQADGARHGAAGWYADGDFSSDADWVYGVGARIRALEEELSVSDDSIFELYRESHAAALPPSCESCGAMFQAVEGKAGTYTPNCDCNDCTETEGDWTVAP